VGTGGQEAGPRRGQGGGQEAAPGARVQGPDARARLGRHAGQVRVAVVGARCLAACEFDSSPGDQIVAVE